MGTANAGFGTGPEQATAGGGTAGASLPGEHLPGGDGSVGNTPLRVGNASGFYGDRLSAVREMLTDGPLDVLTGDYLAELTMLILGRDRMKDPARGYAKTFLRQMEDELATALDRGVRIVVNAGGLNPSGLREALLEIADRQGLTVRVAHVAGDDLSDRASALGLGTPLTANAYLGAWGIAECLHGGADVVVTGRVTDASLLVGAAAAHHGWHEQDYDALAGAVAAGHIVECGAQATGGNYAFLPELLAAGYDLNRPGFPIAEVRQDGTSVITKHAGTGGAVTVDTVKAQLLYEVADVRYAGPDVTARFDQLEVVQDGADRVRISGARGEPPPPTLKVSTNSIGGYRNQVEFVLTGLDIETKTALVRGQLESALHGSPPNEMRWELVRSDVADADTEERASAILRCVVKDPDASVVGRAFSSAAVELALASYPGFHVTSAPSDAAPYGTFQPSFVDAAEVEHVAVLPDGAQVAIGSANRTTELVPVADPALPTALPDGARQRAPLGRIAAARSGDKGGDANIGVWVRSDPEWRWLAHELTSDRLRELLPETADLTIHRYAFPNLRAVNFVVEGLLGAGAAAQARFDPQAKALAEWLRSRELDIPEVLL